MFEGELPQRLGDFPRVQRVQPLHHGAALAAVEVVRVAELAHAGVDGDEPEEDAQRQQHHSEVHPAAGVIGVPDGLVAGPASAPLVLAVVVRLRELLVGVPALAVARRLVVLRFVVRAADGAHGGEQPGALGGGVVAVGALAADDGRLDGLDGQVGAVAPALVAVALTPVS